MYLTNQYMKHVHVHVYIQYTTTCVIPNPIPDVFKEVPLVSPVPLDVVKLSFLRVSPSFPTLMSSFTLGVVKEEMKCLKYCGISLR